MEYQPIAYIHNDFPTKFGLPRQSGLSEHLISQIVMEKEYRKEVGRLRIEMVEILREKGRIDEMIRRLDMDEQTFLQLRFEKGNGFDYISMKMHLSRATLFRMQERVLEKMIGMKTDRD